MFGPLFVCRFFNIQNFPLIGPTLFLKLLPPPTFPLFHRTSGLLLIQKLLRVLGSQLTFVQSLFQRRPESLGCYGDEWLRLEARARALQHRALEQEVASQRRIQVCWGRALAEGDLNPCIEEEREVLVEKGEAGEENQTWRGKERRRCLLLQEWSRWEDDCGRLSAMLDDAEAFISSGEPEASDEKLAEHRLDACQVNLPSVFFPHLRFVCLNLLPSHCLIRLKTQMTVLCLKCGEFKTEQ